MEASTRAASWQAGFWDHRTGRTYRLVLRAQARAESLDPFRPVRARLSPVARLSLKASCADRACRPIPLSMSATKIMWGQIAIVFAIVLVTTWGATQWVAWKLGFQPQLGQPWFELGPKLPVYLPPAFFWWWYAYDAYAPK